MAHGTTNDRSSGGAPGLARRIVRLLRRTRRRTRAQARSIAALSRENGPGAVARFVLLSALGVRRPVALTVAGAPLVLRTAAPDLTVAQTTLGEEFDGVERLVDRDREGLVVDAGGFIGTAAIRLARMFPNARIVTLEPNRENFAALSRNVAGEPRIHPLNAALAADGAGETLTLYDRGTGDVGFTIVGRAADAAQAARMYEVPVWTMDRLMAEFGAERLLFLKLDIEGAEHDIFKACPAWLDRVDVMMVELHERIVAGCEAAFQTATAGRSNRRFDGEKHVSLRAADPAAA